MLSTIVKCYTLDSQTIFILFWHLQNKLSLKFGVSSTIFPPSTSPFATSGVWTQLLFCFVSFCFFKSAMAGIFFWKKKKKQERRKLYFYLLVWVYNVKNLKSFRLLSSSKMLVCGPIHYRLFDWRLITAICMIRS